MNKAYFEGWYYKHQKDGRVLALIPGRSSKEAFIQVITNEGARYVPYNLGEYRKGKTLRVGDSEFSSEGIKVNIHAKGMELTGRVDYKSITPAAYDVMGPFRFFPMECRHSVQSLHHDLVGNLRLNDSICDFTGGMGYIEGDCGRSFPISYAWAQCNAFDDKCCVMASIAKIPFAGLKFWGCICIVWHKGKEYRLATYKGARIIKRTEQTLEVAQRGLRLRITVLRQNKFSLFAPDQGQMNRTIHESASCAAHFYFEADGIVLLNEIGEGAGFEYVE